MSAQGSRRAIVAAMLANMGIAVAKFLAFLATRSSSMLAESIHSVADTSNQGLLLLGSARARRQATAAHPFGFGRERYFWSFIVALVLFSLGGLFAIFEGIEKLLNPHELENPAWAVGVLLLAIVLEGSSLRTAMKESAPLRGNRSWIGFVRHAKTPELPVVLLEDTGALIGLALALVGVGLSLVTGDAFWDGIGTICIGTLLVIIAAVLATEMRSLLLGEAASKADVAAIEHAIAGSPSVRRLIHLRTEHLGPDQLLVAGKIELDPQLSFVEVADAIDETERRIRGAVTSAAMIYLEPDVYEEQVDTRPAPRGDDPASPA